MFGLRFASRCGDTVTKAMAMFLLEAASQPLLHALEQWIYHGIVDDSHGEFMVSCELTCHCVTTVESCISFVNCRVHG